MKWYVSSDGATKLWYELEEIEGLMEREMARSGIVPTGDEPVLDLERFVEGHLGVRLDQHANLPRDILGETQFFTDAPPLIRLQRDLTRKARDLHGPPPGLRGRWRATLAHEAAHVLLHAVIFDEKSSTPGLARTEPLFRCGLAITQPDKGYDWREVQANRGMASLLMPRALFRAIGRAVLSERGLEPIQYEPESEQGIALSREMAGRFEVSRLAARIRLEVLGFLITRPRGSIDAPAHSENS